MKYLIYKVTNLINNKTYIGCHSTQNIDDGYMGSGKLVLAAIKKYGIENFKKDILYTFDNYETMIRKEEELVNEEYIQRNDTYNLSVGGAFDYREDRSKPENSKKLKGRKFTPETIRRMSGRVPVVNSEGQRFKVATNDPRYLSGELIHTSVGRQCSEDTKQRIREKAIGRGHAAETRAKISKAMKGENNPFYGKQHTDETKKQISKKNKGRTAVFTDKHRKNLSIAMTKNHFGYIWIVNLKSHKIKRIHPSELPLYINTGWIKGRKV